MDAVRHVPACATLGAFKLLQDIDGLTWLCRGRYLVALDDVHAGQVCRVIGREAFTYKGCQWSMHCWHSGGATLRGLPDRSSAFLQEKSLPVLPPRPPEAPCYMLS